MGSRLAVGSFYPRNWRLLNLWGYFQYQAVETTFALRVASPFPLSSGRAFFFNLFHIASLCSFLPALVLEAFALLTDTSWGCAVSLLKS